MLSLIDKNESKRNAKSEYNICLTKPSLWNKSEPEPRSSNLLDSIVKPNLTRISTLPGWLLGAPWPGACAANLSGGDLFSFSLGSGCTTTQLAELGWFGGRFEYNNNIYSHMNLI
jgi:hypothetical protein